MTQMTELERRLRTLIEPVSSDQSETAGRLRSIAVHTGLNFASQALFAGSTLVTSIIASRALGRTDKGVLAFLMLIPVLLQAFLDLGMEQGLTVRVANGSLASPSRRRILSGLVAHGLISLVIATGIVVVAPLVPSRTVAAVAGQKALLTVIACMLTVIQHDLAGLLYGYKKIPFVSLARMAAGTAVAGGSAVLYLTGSGSVIDYLGIYVAGTAALTAALALRLRPLLPRWPQDHEGRPIDWHIVSQAGLPFYGLKLTHFAMTRLDSLLLGATRPSAELGLYSNAVNLVEVMWYFPGALGQVLLPHTAGKPNRRLCTQTLLAVAVLSAVCGVVLGLAGHILIVALFGPSFAESFEPLVLLLPGAVAMSCARIGQVWLLIYDRAAVVRRINLLAAGTGSIVWWLAIPRYGLAAAALVSSILYTCVGIATVLLLLRVSGTHQDGTSAYEPR
jgi:O-antigen/teichoic acid export membrane protein